MKWKISFLHNDASCEDVTVDEANLAAVFARMTERECPCRVIAVTEAPKAAELLEEAEPDALAYLDLPYEHHMRLRTNNVQERANRELKRRSRVVQVFPSRKSLIHMIAAIFAEMDEDWTSRRWFAESSIGLAYGSNATAPSPSYTGSASEHAARIMGLVMADNQLDRKAA